MQYLVGRENLEIRMGGQVVELFQAPFLNINLVMTSGVVTDIDCKAGLRSSQFFVLLIDLFLDTSWVIRGHSLTWKRGVQMSI